MNTWGSNLKISIFGESHGSGLGVVLDGIPSGLVMDNDFINSEMNRRAPGKDTLSTPRKEADSVEILSGVLNGKTTGTPICAVIRNTNTRSYDYTPNILRPGHADFTGFIKYGENHDFRGGGHFSGRITAGLVFAGAVAKLWLKEQGVTIGSHIKKIHNVSEESFMDITLTAKLLSDIAKKSFPVIDDLKGDKMKDEILSAKADKNSVGGIVECAVIGINPGLGSPFFESLESKISSLIFSIPGVKGVEFGSGFDFADMYGYDANDSFYTDGKNIYTKTNHNGGINGGISNGMPIIFSAALKPTPSIGRKQETVDTEKMENIVCEIKGRHDPCVVKRAAVVVESAAALAILDSML